MAWLDSVLRRGPVIADECIAAQACATASVWAPFRPGLRI
jgi:hypothetical protein